MILITGANGQLGYDFQRLFDSLKAKYIATDVADFDITNEKSIDDFFLKHNNISLIINCAAYNDVDKAESEPDFCMLLNSRAPFNLAKKAKEIGATFVTYSKDLAYFSWKLIETKKYGLYHMSNSGICSKYDQAKYVLDKIGWTGKLGTSKTEDFNLPAKRSKFSKLDSTKLENIVGEKIPSWQDAIDRFLKELN